ncbi:MAG: hypothetical protein O2865_15640 [Planctomycetota bacterium]|nr:hypothetical protein [Planctomycetota bacterium]
MNRSRTASLLRAAGILGLTLLAAGASDLPGQALKIERHAYRRLLELRAELASRLSGADASRRAAVAAQAAQRSSGQPFDDIARLLALAEGVEADLGYRARTGLLCLALPTVVDPDVFGQVHVTMHAPRIIPDLGAARFDVQIVDAAGEVVREEVIDRDTTVDDLLRYRASRAIDVSDLPDGSYRVRVATSFAAADGDSGRGVADTAKFSILRGYKRRADALPIVVGVDAGQAENARRILEGIAPGRQDRISQAILTGSVWEVAGPYAGEPQPESLNPIFDLVGAERILANLRADRPALSGLHGRMTLGFPLREADVQDGSAVRSLSIDLPTTDRQGPLPLFVHVPATPSWDEDGTRPMSPRSLGAAFGAEQILSAWMDDPAWFGAVLESPGTYPSSAHAVEDAVRFLIEVLPVRERGVVLIGEREGAYAVARAAMALGDVVRGLVQINGSGLSRQDVSSRSDLRVLLVSSSGHPTRPVLSNLAGPERPNVQLLDLEDVPAVAAFPSAAPSIRAFVQETLDVRGVFQETGRGAEVTEGVVVAEVAARSSDRAAGLLGWCRVSGYSDAVLRSTDDDRLQVVIPATGARAAEVVSELREAGPPGFDPELFARDADGPSLPRVERFGPR